MEALAVAKPGDKIAYHIGLLMFDRLPHGNSEAEQKRAIETDELAKVVWAAASMYFDKDHGKYGAWRRNKKEARCNLVQRRLHDPFGMEYIAVKI